MNDFIKGVLTLAAKMETKYMTADGIISAHPIFIFDIHVSSTDNDYSFAKLYNGTSASGIHIIDLQVNKKDSRNFSWMPPLFLSNGGYLDALGDFKSATFHFLRADR